MIAVQRIGHATYETPDLSRQIDYYTQVIGFGLAERGKDRAILTTRLGEEVLVLEAGTSARCSKLSFQLGPHADLAQVAAQLRPKGIGCEMRRDITPAIAEAAVFEDPKGTLIELFARCKTAQPVETQGVSPLKLGHLAHVVPDAKAITDFYVENLGFRVSDWMENFFSFLRCGPDHHTVNFRTGDKNFMHHIAFELKDWAHLGLACETLGRHKRPILWGPLRHGIGHNLAIYHRDPDDHRRNVHFDDRLEVPHLERRDYEIPVAENHRRARAAEHRRGCQKARDGQRLHDGRAAGGHRDRLQHDGD